MKKTDNVFAQEIRIFHNGEGEENWMGGEAWKEGDRILEAAINRDYLDVSTEQLSDYVRSAFRAMDERDLVNIYPGEEMPCDAFSGIVRQTSYAVTALCIYLKVKLGREATAWMDEALKRLMDAAFRSGIVGHGCETNDMIRKVMLALLRARLPEYFNQGTMLSEVFSKSVAALYNRLLVQSHNRDDESFMRRSMGRTPCLLPIYAALFGGCNPVFVYGTLMSGQPAEDMLGDEAIIGGDAILKNYAMYDLGSFPGVVPMEGEQVVGEVYFVDDDTLSRLDRYESEGSLYRREDVRVIMADGRRVDAMVYVYNHPVSGAPVRERWGTKDEDEIWYAAYGSSLSTERFRYYLEGGVCPQNGKRYRGCTDRSLWKETVVDKVSGRVYFARHSPSWNGGGVAFFSRENYGNVIIRRYRITWGQLKDIQLQEGPAWYHRIECLGFSDGRPVYTLTSEKSQTATEPDKAYLNLVRDALVQECGCTEENADRYLRNIRR